ncbi:uncharacterized protein EI90DRAFT_3030669 [Cantharellus anzutake]|uniref:uncharacterized protein n=1 Tax=Cantharellus anzutake TaxID=1750568 RepID=UPI0019053248|nr:uncharacterized protein EI90DRAFT_3030669 [Cantharellus anzutake]KAF8342917.1 hypothetical protein EI90DRAFT_3030669 [Cantharellus anzutake]
MDQSHLEDAHHQLLFIQSDATDGSPPHLEEVRHGDGLINRVPFSSRDRGLVPIGIHLRNERPNEDELVRVRGCSNADVHMLRMWPEDRSCIGVSAIDIEGHPHNTVVPSRLFDVLVHVPSSAHTTYPAHVYLDALRGSAYAQHAYITSVRRFRNNDAIQHRSLILQVVRDGMPDFKLRIDRFRDRTLSFLQFCLLRRGRSDALDTITVSENLQLLYDARSSEEAVLDLPQPIPLLEFGSILEVVLVRSHSYDVFAENCWFVVSTLEEAFVNVFSACYVKGKASHSRLARRRRTGIWNELGLRGSK